MRGGSGEASSSSHPLRACSARTSFTLYKHNKPALLTGPDSCTGREKLDFRSGVWLSGRLELATLSSRHSETGASLHLQRGQDKLVDFFQHAQRSVQEIQAWLHDLLPTLNGRMHPFASLAVEVKSCNRGGKVKYPTCSHEKDLQALFAEIDTNREGFLDARKLQAALSRLGLPCGADYLRSLMQQYDANHDGRVDFKEFASYVEKRQQDMVKAFDQLDADTNGRHLGAIDTRTLVRVLRKAGLPAQDEDAKHMIDLLDRDHDGVISFNEFCRFACLLPSAQVCHQQILFDWIDSSDWVAHMEYRLSMIPPKASYQRLIAGGVAGAVSRTCVAPFERLRTIMMTESAMTVPQVCKSILAADGILGFWKGNRLTVLKTIPQTAIQFAAYDGTKDFLTSLFPRHHKHGLSQMEKVFAGCVAGAAAILATYPMETLRTRMAIAGGSSSIRKGVNQVWQQQGFRGFYQGLKCGVLCEMLSTGLGFWAYELGQSVFRELHEGQSPSPRQRGFIGGLSALAVMTTTMPLEVVLRRLQVQGLPGKPVVYHNARHCFATIMEQEGFRAFYRGTLSSFMKVGPSIGATYAIFALLVQTWGIGGIRSFSHLDQQDEAALAAGEGK